MTTNLPKLKELAQAAQQNQYDPVALNDYGMAVPPATVLELIAEIERHRMVDAEGCKPEISNRPAAGHSADTSSTHNLDKAEGCKADLINLPFFYALAGPDGKPHYDDFCVADNPADLECHEDGVTIVPLFTHPAPENVTALREDIARGNRIQLAMALDLSAIAQALGIPPEEQQGGAAESIAAIQDLRTQLAARAGSAEPSNNLTPEEERAIFEEELQERAFLTKEELERDGETYREAIVRYLWESRHRPLDRVALLKATDESGASDYEAGYEAGREEGRRLASAMPSSTEHPHIEIGRTHKHTGACCKEGAEYGRCNCGVIIEGVAVKAEPSDVQLIEIARKAVVDSTHRYLYMPTTPEDAKNWLPHRWVIEAMRSAMECKP